MTSRNGDPPRPRSIQEKELERVQRTVTAGQLADHRRRELIVHLYREGMTQVELAARLSRAATAAGGSEVGLDAVQKLVARYRYRV